MAWGIILHHVTPATFLRQMVVPCGIYGEQMTLIFPPKYPDFIVIPQTPHNYPRLHITFKKGKF